MKIKSLLTLVALLSSSVIFDASYAMMDVDHANLPDVHLSWDERLNYFNGLFLPITNAIQRNDGIRLGAILNGFKKRPHIPTEHILTEKKNNLFSYVFKYDAWNCLQELLLKQHLADYETFLQAAINFRAQKCLIVIAHEAIKNKNNRIFSVILRELSRIPGGSDRLYKNSQNIITWTIQYDSEGCLKRLFFQPEIIPALTNRDLLKEAILEHAHMCLLFLLKNQNLSFGDLTRYKKPEYATIFDLAVEKNNEFAIMAITHHFPAIANVLRNRRNFDGLIPAEQAFRDQSLCLPLLDPALARKPHAQRRLIFDEPQTMYRQPTVVTHSEIEPEAPAQTEVRVYSWADDDGEMNFDNFDLDLQGQ